MFKFCPNCGAEIKNSTKYGFKCESCLKHFYYNSKPTVGIVPYFQNEILIARRGIEPDKGCFDTIGGFLENGEDPLDGAVREFKEETGIDINKKDLTLQGVVMASYVFEGIEYELLNIIYAMPFSKEISIIPQDDVAELLWVPIQGPLAQNKLTSYMKKVLDLLQSSNLV